MDDTTTYSTLWNGIEIRITHTPERFGYLDDIEVESIAPPRAPLPITATGYVSHFTAKTRIEALGGPVAFIHAWLDAWAKQPHWQQQEMQRRQLSLFD